MNVNSLFGFAHKIVSILLCSFAMGFFIVSCTQEAIKPKEQPVIAKNLGNGSIRYELPREEIIQIMTLNVADSLKSVLSHPDEMSIRPMGDQTFYLVVRAASEKENKVVNFAMELRENPGGDMTLTGLRHTCSGFFCSSCSFDFGVNELGNVVITGCHCNDRWGFCNHTVSNDPPRFQ